ncbi:MAG: hypothetical protein K9W46_00835 [Candidatus Heimdallarchaeum endolithica]|uniref:Uncharacterized protein n=1 Tax=Candidatus Heimdallarchaeum endolithica TaxID=2876572 RepID=A0A9Y1BR91_9ARCH|nr:MAG: hypothetical protein K9W46_00835 [Candidatus Heimdallarchaeum endolithica]
MQIIVNSKKEKELLVKLLDFLNKKDLELFLYFKDPESFNIEEIFDSLCDCDIRIDPKEEPVIIE